MQVKRGEMKPVPPRAPLHVLLDLPIPKMYNTPMAEDGTMQEKGTERCCWKDRQFWLRALVLLVLGYVFCSYFNDTFFDGDYKIMPVRQVYMVVLGTLFLYFCAKAHYIGICLYSLACLLFVFLRYPRPRMVASFPRRWYAPSLKRIPRKLPPL